MRRAFPRTFAALGALENGEEVLEHLAGLEAAWGRRKQPRLPRGDGPQGAPDVDILLVGGGLSLLYGAYWARCGRRVAIADRRRIGSGHREWNISRGELAPLVASGLFGAEEVEALIAMRYDHGGVRFFGGETHRVHDVLDCAVRADALLAGLRARAAAAGAILLDGHALDSYAVGPAGVRAWFEAPAGGEPSLTCRVLVDGSGASSPHGCFDLVCPTVGGVLAGLERGEGPRAYDPRIGEILVSTEGLDAGRQHLWEGFPAPNDRLTTYLFYYAEPHTLGPHPLFALYERFFTTLPRYKAGQAVLEKATYGLIPACSRLRRSVRSPGARVLLVGDAAGRHSPLTCCGFGAMVRGFRSLADGLNARLEEDRLDAASLGALGREPEGLRVMGGLALMMVGERYRGSDDQAINRVLEAAFGALGALGQDVFAAFLRDELRFGTFMAFMRLVARRRPAVYREVFSRLSARELVGWTLQAGRFGWDAMAAPSAPPPPVAG